MQLIVTISLFLRKSFLKTNMTTYYRYAIDSTLIVKSDRRPNPYRKRVFSIWGHSLKKEGWLSFI
nr:hypothetical protein [uncultured bacterium]